LSSLFSVWDCGYNPEMRSGDTFLVTEMMMRKPRRVRFQEPQLNGAEPILELALAPALPTAPA
jgi:hypothetical protein